MNLVLLGFLGPGRESGRNHPDRNSATKGVPEEAGAEKENKEQLHPRLGEHQGKPAGSKTATPAP